MKLPTLLRDIFKNLKRRLAMKKLQVGGKIREILRLCLKEICFSWMSCLMEHFNHKPRFIRMRKFRGACRLEKEPLSVEMFPFAARSLLEKIVVLKHPELDPIPPLEIRKIL